MPGIAHCTMRLAAVRRETGAWHKAMPPPTPRYRGTQPHAQAVLFLHLRVSLSRVVGPDGVTPVPFPSGGPVASYPLSFLERGLQWFSGPPGFWYRVCATGSKSVCTPVAPPLEPSLCSQLPTPPWWRSRSPTLPPAPLLLWHALYAVYHVCASACPVCGMGACGVCVVIGCGCELRVGSCVANTARGSGCSGVPWVGLPFPPRTLGTGDG